MPPHAARIAASRASARVGAFGERWRGRFMAILLLEESRPTPRHFGRGGAKTMWAEANAPTSPDDLEMPARRKTGRKVGETA